MASNAATLVPKGAVRLPDSRLVSLHLDGIDAVATDRACAGPAQR